MSDWMTKVSDPTVPPQGPAAIRHAAAVLVVTGLDHVERAEVPGMAVEVAQALGLAPSAGVPRSPFTRMPQPSPGAQP